MIVLGCRRRSAIKSMVLGRVSYGVVYSSDRPVLIAQSVSPLAPRR